MTGKQREYRDWEVVVFVDVVIDLCIGCSVSRVLDVVTGGIE